MIKIKESPIIGRVIQRKYCSTIIVTNYEKCPVRFLQLLPKLAFVINTTQCYPDMIFVISNDDLDELVFELIKISEYCKVEG